ncbi:sensor histidine kinase [Hyalangium rubrum]|uniref:histidine kinase n=1 Tax=Hyalangium rubrum TaxID=3103134 RepID=A0ABU5H4H9_9BACT|nr:ATP-binding protein [Hyalangium sp. s54d21]MDY7228255.1 ATP-binding protein [Hyalangium sp. s54d21]
MPHSTTVPSAPPADLLNEEILQAEHRQLLGSFLTTVSDGVSIADARGTCIYSSPYARQLFGAGGTASAPIQGNAFGLFHADEQTPFESDQLPIRRALKGEEVRDVEMFIRNENVPQGRHVRCDGIPLRDEQGRVIGGVSLVKNLAPARRSEGEELERRITERTAQLQLANRELEDFAYSVAHDLRAPLRAITIFSDALIEDCSKQLDATGVDYVKRIRGGTQRMADRINGILALSKVNRATLSASECDLSALARVVFEQLQAQDPKRTVRLTVQEGLVDRGDPQLLRSVLENLLGNAWKFTRERPVAEVEFGVTQAQGARAYFVKDNGAGFEMAYQHKLFGVFQRLHSPSEFEGSGVGLATAQRIIRRHGGRIWGEGEPGQGARFFFTLNEQPLPSATTVASGAPHD